MAIILCDIHAPALVLDQLLVDGDNTGFGLGTMPSSGVVLLYTTEEPGPVKGAGAGAT